MIYPPLIYTLFLDCSVRRQQYSTRGLIVMKTLAIKLLLSMSLLGMAGCSAEDFYAFTTAAASALSMAQEDSYNSSSAYTSNTIRQPTFEETRATYERNNPTPKRQATTASTPTRTTPSYSKPTPSNSRSNASSNTTEAPSIKPSALLVVWQSKHGKWWGAGPTQILWTSHETKDELFEYLYNEKFDSITYVGVRGKFKVYRLDRAQVNSDWDVRKWLKVKHNISTTDIK